jgi:hypothetical protein
MRQDNVFARTAHEDHSVTNPNSFNARQTLTVGDRTYTYYSLAEAERNGLAAPPAC